MTSTQEPAASLSRRTFLQASAAGAAAWSVLGASGDAAYARTKRGPAARTVPFNANWLFGGPAVPGSDKPDFDDSTFGQVTLPHTVTDLSWREWDPANWQDVWIYRRHFQVPRSFEGHRVFVDFGAALTTSTLTLNGQKLGEHVGGYLPFSFEITDKVNPGDNVLAVAVDAHFNINVPPNRPEPYGPRSVDFWQPGGIYRQASLRAVPPIFLADVFAKPVDVLGSGRRLEVECTIDAGTVPEGPVEVEVQLRDDNQRVAAKSTRARITKRGQTTVTLTLTELGDIELWDVDNPRLYDVVTTLSVSGQKVHDYATRIGFRETHFTKHGFFLNGRRLKIFGLNRHQFYPYAGGSMPPRVQRKDAEILKNELNCNMVRCSHYPQAEEFFDACDELGLMAWEEAPGWGLYMGDEQWQQRAIRIVGDMVRRGRNHPSIIIWGARINETPDNVELWSTTRDLAHRLDDSRPTTGGMHAALANSQNFVQDVFSLNDYWREDGHAALRPPRTDFPYLASEAVGTLSGPARYYRRDDPVLIQQGEALAHAWVHEQSFADDRYCGLLGWCGFDYPSGSGNQWRGVKYNGVVDLFRELKPGAAIYQAQIDPGTRPVIAPAFYWDFGGKSLPLGQGHEAMICSNCERLEILVDGQPYATVHPDRKRFGHLPYPPSFVDLDGVDGSSWPELRIDGYVGGERVASRRFSSDPTGDVLSVTADDTVLTADGIDATRVAFRVLDTYGAPRHYVGEVAKEITITVEGAGTLVGDSPFAFAEAGGVGAVWIRSNYRVAGRTDVTVTHPKLGSQSVTIHSRRPPGGGTGTNTDLTLTSPKELFRPGASVPLTATLTNMTHPALRDVELGLLPPEGWSVEATTPTSFAHVRPGQAVHASWTATVPGDVEPGRLRMASYATFTAAGKNGSERVSETFFVPAPPVPLAEAYDNVGISDDSEVDSADFDGVGNSYSQQALIEAGLAPGARITHQGIAYTWPDVPAGQLDNVLAAGQTIAMSGSGDTIGFLGASSGGSLGGTGAVYYEDGTASEFSVSLADWWYGPGADTEVIAALPYLNSQGVGGRPRGRRDHTVRIFVTSAPMTPGKQVTAVRLPEASSGPGGRIFAMHVFAVAVGDRQGVQLWRTRPRHGDVKPPGSRPGPPR